MFFWGCCIICLSVYMYMLYAYMYMHSNIYAVSQAIANCSERVGCGRLAPRVAAAAGARRCAGRPGAAPSAAAIPRRTSRGQRPREGSAWPALGSALHWSTPICSGVSDLQAPALGSNGADSPRQCQESPCRLPGAKRCVLHMKAKRQKGGSH